jgi:uncharacterized repeat protein (TIGR01451 family)
LRANTSIYSVKQLILLGVLLAGSMQSFAISVSVIVQRHSYCGRQSGYAIANIDGGIPPYTISWSNGSTEYAAEGLFPGDYSITVSDSQGDQATANFTIDHLNGYGELLTALPLGHCPGDPPQAAVYTGYEWGSEPPLESIYGPHPYTFSHPQLLGALQAFQCQDPSTTLWNMLHFNEPGDYWVNFWDANNCPGEVNVIVGNAWTSFPQVQVLNVMPSCASTNTGSVTYSLQGGQPYYYGVKLRPEAITDLCSAQVHSFGLDPQMSGTTHTVNNLAAGNYWLITTNDVFDVYAGSVYDYACKDSVLVTVPSLGADCGVLNGRVYIDDNVDCIMGGSENRIPGAIVEITPGPYYRTTNSSGAFSIGLPFGTYTVTEQHPVFEQSCPGQVTVASATQTLNVGCAGGEPLDLQLSMANGYARPGFGLQYSIYLNNLTPASTGTITLTMTLDPTLGFVSADPAPSSVAGNVLTWTAPQLVMTQVFQQRIITIQTQIPPDIGLLGTTLTTTAQVTTANTDGNLSNNSAISNQLVTGSYDPNDKLATTSSGNTNTWQIDGDEWIDYTIRFQNTGTDTAFNVIITDTLPASLDPTSITWGAGSHTHTRELIGQGVLKFIFPNIMLPDSNVNEPLSNGFVSFRIKPHLPLLPGDVIENIANIYFDFNPPVITDPSVLVATTSTGLHEPRVPAAMVLYPQPSTGIIQMKSPIHDLRSLKILAIDGREVRVLPASPEQTVFDLSFLSSGRYIGEFISGDGTRVRSHIQMLR